MKLFIDTETTGLPNRHAFFGDPSQPHLVQLAALLTDDEGTEKGCFHGIILPQDWTIPAEAAAVHGITTEIAATLGIPLVGALAAFSTLCFRAQELIAHNLDFDLIVMRAALRRAGGNYLLLEKPRHSCTMRASAEVLKLPGRRGQYKWPKLQEAYRHFYHQELEGSHDAMTDVRACAAVHFALLGKPQALSPAVEAAADPLFVGSDRLSNGFTFQEVSECLKREVRFGNVISPSGWQAAPWIEPAPNAKQI